MMTGNERLRGEYFVIYVVPFYLFLVCKKVANAGLFPGLVTYY